MPVYFMLCVGLMTLLAGPARALAVGDEQELVDFRSRIDAYMVIQHRLVQASPEQRPTRDPANIRAAQQQLASLIRAVRHGAERGDILDEPIARVIRARVERQLRGSGTADAHAAHDTGEAAPFALTPNGSYPEGTTFVSLPEAILAALPSLPPELEFRVVGHHLILHDVRANVVVDYLMDVI